MAPRPSARRRAWFAGLLLAGCAPAAAPEARTATPAPAAEAVEAEVHARVEAHRASRGLPPLAYDARIAGIARAHSRAMAAGRVPFGHDGFDARGAAVGALFAVRSLAENVAYDGRTPVAENAVRGWIASAGHRANLEGAFDVTGVGVARAADGTYYLTQIFAARR